jgi:hypothetical protein
MGQTPNIDAMAAEGVVFREAYAPSALTCPSHTSMLTGLTPLLHGAVVNGTRLGSDFVTLPDILRSDGYETAAFISGMPLTHIGCGLGTHFLTYMQDFSPWGSLPQLATKIRPVEIAVKVAGRYGLDFKREPWTVIGTFSMTMSKTES